MIWPTRTSRSRGSSERPADGEVAAVGSPVGSLAGKTAGSPTAAWSDGPGGPGLAHGWPLIVLAALYLAGFALVVRTLVTLGDESLLPWYLGLFALFLVLFTLVWVTPRPHPVLLHVIFVVQCSTILALLALDPKVDYVTALFVALSYQAAIVFNGRARWTWVGGLVALIGVSLMVFHGPAEGLGLGLSTMAVALAFAALAVASQDIEEARVESLEMVAELEATNHQLEKYAAEVSELAAVEERNRLARELHDSVSQSMFGIQLATRSVQIMLEKEPEAVPAQLAQLQELTQEALVRMRGLISELRPKAE
jgi:signal transduction histidine kinase